MNHNVGTADRVVRIILGLVLLSLIFWGPKTLWGLLGLIPLVTAIISWCPLYTLVGVRTDKGDGGQSGTPAE